MDVNVLQRQFARIGARAEVHPLINPRQTRGALAIDIGRDAQGEFFDIGFAPNRDVNVNVLNADPGLRHLLLMSRSESSLKSKFLCGHDERHWFVAAIPETRPVSTVRSAMEALKPVEILRRQDQHRVRPKNRNRRRNEAFIRQGEWFFVPEPNLVVQPKLVLTNEPLRRGGGKPHMVEFLYRSGGELVYVCGQRPNGITEAQYGALISRKPEAKKWAWTTMRRNMGVYVTGRVRHADHATIELRGWHRVLMNTENLSAAMRHVAFLD